MVPQPPDSNALMLALSGFRLVPVRSPLLGESRLISTPPGTEMFQFPGFATTNLWIQSVVPGLPQSVARFGDLRLKAC